MSSAGNADRDDPVQRGTPPGSLRYFSTLFAPARARPLLEAVHAFDAEIRDLLNAQDHDVAHARMQWWRAEVDRYAAGRPQHPITVGLLGLTHCASHDPLLLHEALAAADLDLARMTYCSWIELEAYAFRCTGSLQTLAAAALAGPRDLSAAERDFARRLGSAMRQTEMLRDRSIDLRHGRLYIPTNVLQAAGVEPTDLRSASPEAIARILTDWRDRIGESLVALPALLSAAERSAQRPGLVLAALHQRLLERIDPQADAVLDRAEVPPWSRLWTAWTTAVRYA